MVAAQLVGTLQILTGLGALLVLNPAIENRGKPGSYSFVMFSLGVAAYAIATGADLLTANYSVSVALGKVVVSAGVLTTVSWLFLALETTERKSVDRRLVGAFAGYLLVAWLLIWINPGGFVMGGGHEMVGEQLDPDYGIGFWTLLGLGYVQVLFGTALLTVASVQSRGTRRHQTGLLALAILPTFGASVLNGVVIASGRLTYDYTVFGWAVTLGMFAVALYSARFLDIVPVARRTAIAEMDDAMVTLDSQDRVIDANEAARELFGVEDGYESMSAAAFFGSASESLLPRFAGVTDTETEVSAEIDGEQRYFSVTVSSVGTEPNRGRVLVLHDITERKQRERELRRQTDRLEQFASVVSHDLRTPLGVIDGKAELARETGQEAHFDAIERATHRMETIIEETLTLARAGKTIEETESVVLADVAKSAWGNSPTVDSELELDVPEEMTVQADRNRLFQTFENLFRNAIEHNEHQVTVRVGLVSTSSTDDAAPVAGFFVEDDGRGISNPGPEKVFEHGYTTSDTGSGLGLTIVANVVEAHGWSVGVSESDSGGARFEVTSVEFAES